MISGLIVIVPATKIISVPPNIMPAVFAGRKLIKDPDLTANH
jgi:hypothetical protein